MAVINNLKANAVSFKVNDVSSRFQDVISETTDILNGGDLLNNTLEYKFRVTGLQGHIVKSIVVKSLLLNSDDTYCSSRNITIGIDSYGSIFRGQFTTSESAKTIVSTEFNEIQEQESNQLDITIAVATNSTESCYFGLQAIVINLQDIDYYVYISFTGPKNNRSISTITVNSSIINSKSEQVTFSKDPTQNFDRNTDVEAGKIYFRKDGIYVNEYQYGTVIPATENRSGIVKLKKQFDTQDGSIIILDENGTAATPQLIIQALNNATELVGQEIIEPGSDSSYGVVKLSGNEFNIDNEGTIIIDAEAGVAATPLLVANALLLAKTYTDQNAQHEIGIEINETETVTENNVQVQKPKVKSLREGFTFSQHFEEKDNKIYISWLNI